tara:strand:- start:102 stop:332 length:231 start_codon:yes stop_codon:yes gene_type:complete
MGMGDVKLVGLIGLVTGFPLVLVALLLGISAAFLVSILLVVIGKKKMTDRIPLGSFLALGTILTLLWGGDMLTFIL